MRSVNRTLTVRLTTLITGAGAAAALTMHASGCSSDHAQGSSTPPSETARGTSEGMGDVGLSLTLPGGQSINTVNWTITDAGGAVIQQNSVNVQNSLTVSFTVGNLPAGGTYTITLSATSTDGSATCTGSAQFQIAAHATTNLTVPLRCALAAPETGTLTVGTQTYGCASLGGASAIPAEVFVGASVSLSASAIAINPAALSFQWSAPSGTFSAAGSASTTFTCTAPGPVTIAVAASDGPVPDGGSCDSSSSATVQVTCDLAPEAGAVDATVSDAGSGAQALVTTLDPGVAADRGHDQPGHRDRPGRGQRRDAVHARPTSPPIPNNTQTIVERRRDPFLADRHRARHRRPASATTRGRDARRASRT